MRFLVRPRFPPDDRGIRSAILGDEDCKGVSTLQDMTRQGGMVSKDHEGENIGNWRPGRTRSGMRKYVTGESRGMGRLCDGGTRRQCERFLVSSSASYVQCLSLSLLQCLLRSFRVKIVEGELT